MLKFSILTSFVAISLLLITSCEVEQNVNELVEVQPGLNDTLPGPLNYDLYFYHNPSDGCFFLYVVMPESANVELYITAMDGTLVKTISKTNLPQGQWSYSIGCGEEHWASGDYFCILNVPKRKLSIIKKFTIIQ